MIETRREFCIAVMEVLDDWCEENGFETSGAMQVEFSELVWARMQGEPPPERRLPGMTREIDLGEEEG